MTHALLQVENLCASYGERPIVKNVSFTVREQEIWCIAGESGCGKSTLLKALMGIDRSIFAQGSAIFGGRDLIGMPFKERKQLFGQQIGMIFQDPDSYFNPIRTIEKQLKEMLISHGLYERGTFEDTVLDMFEAIGLADGARILKCCPYEMSGGMNQRIAIASAFLLEPQLLLADEPTSALDATVQYQVIQELLKLRELSHTAQIVVTHNLGLAAYLADKVAIMFEGKFVELGEKALVVEQPQHPYTKALIAAVPTIEKGLPTPIDKEKVHAEVASLQAQYAGAVADKNGMLEVSPGHLVCVGGEDL